MTPLEFLHDFRSPYGDLAFTQVREMDVDIVLRPMMRGVFGPPTIFVDRVMFFDNNRLDFVREHLARQEQAA